MKRIYPTLALLALAPWAGAGCDNRYEALSTPPPGLTASLNDEDKSMRISTGVALVFECFHWNGDPCGRDASSNNSAIARILPAALDTLTGDYYREGPQTRSAFVVVGVAEGETDVHAGGDSMSVKVLKVGQ